MRAAPLAAVNSRNFKARACQRPEFSVRFFGDADGSEPPHPGDAAIPIPGMRGAPVKIQTVRTTSKPSIGRAIRGRFEGDSPPAERCEGPLSTIVESSSGDAPGARQPHPGDAPGMLRGGLYPVLTRLTHVGIPMVGET
jgi:hypothetical protein